MNTSLRDSRRSGRPLPVILFLFAFALSAGPAAQEAESPLDRAVSLYSRGSFQEAFSLLSKLSERADEKAKTAISDRLVMMGMSEYFLKDYENAYDALRFAVTLSPTNYAGTEYFVRMRREMDVSKLANARPAAASAESPAAPAPMAAPAAAVPAVSDVIAAPEAAKPPPASPELERLLRQIRAEQDKLFDVASSPKDDKEYRELLSLLSRISKRQEEDARAQAADSRAQEIGNLLAKLDERLKRIEGPSQLTAILALSAALLILVIGILLIIALKGRRVSAPPLAALPRGDTGSRSDRYPRAMIAGEPSPVPASALIGGFHGRIGEVRGLMDEAMLSGIDASLRTALSGRDRSSVTAKLSREIAKRLGLSRGEQESVFIASLAHDAGYLLLDPAELRRLLAARELEATDFAFIKSHVPKGLEYFGDLELPTAVRDAILCHHERMDGTGYPAGISGEDIPPVARILGAAETFVSLLSERSYRKMHSIPEAAALIAAGSGIEYDPSVAAAIVEIVDGLEEARSAV